MREMTHPRLGGSITALATPFRDGRVDESAIVLMIERQIARGTTALVVSGSTGEAAMLSLAEHAKLIRLVAAVTYGRVPVIAGCTASATDVACGLAVAAARGGADALLLAPPPYVKPTQAGIICHVSKVATTADLPVVLYDTPSRTGIAIADATVAALFAQGFVTALKDATGDLARPARLRALCGPDLCQLTGEDALAARHRAMGGDGCISVTANVAPALCSQLHQSWTDGDLDNVSALSRLLAPLHAALSHESNPIPLKAALASLGLCSEALRAPLTPASEATRSTLRHALADVMPQEDELFRAKPMPRLRLVG
jgi:4-hydroxy-tetrahydrodipicolinate synthase